MKSAWRNYDPTRPGSKTNNAFKIDVGLFQTDSDLKIGERALQLISRFTWETIQTSVGHVYASTTNAIGHVDRVDWYGGATFCTNENSSKQNAVTLGNYISVNINDELEDGSLASQIATHEGLYMHEYGHTLQGRNYGFAFLFYVGSQSLISAAKHDDHKNKWYEREASAYARRYFGEEMWDVDVQETHPTNGFLNY